MMQYESVGAKPVWRKTEQNRTNCGETVAELKLERLDGCSPFVLFFHETDSNTSETEAKVILKSRV